MVRKSDERDDARANSNPYFSIVMNVLAVIQLLPSGIKW
jgi:hypothetical protein